MDKREIRENLKIKRAEFQHTREYSIFSQQACKRLGSLISEITQNKSSIIGCYYPLNGELDIKSLFSDFRDIAFTRLDITNSNALIEFIHIENFDCIKDYGPNSDELVNSSRIVYPQIIILPALALDVNFNRIGYGKGHFDKFCYKAAKIGYRPYKIGICFDFQLLGSVPYEEHDEQMDAIVTETRVLRRRDFQGNLILTPNTRAVH
ncbi:MAG: 5-formyltetrahydrofolate cyclo-ligase [Alphaproteobacteria bacterium]|nr:5-formyltetrahydrofolate cyclo-ligase [Alphaproteobacteria bacterium]